MGVRGRWSVQRLVGYLTELEQGIGRSAPSPPPTLLGKCLYSDGACMPIVLCDSPHGQGRGPLVLEDAAGGGHDLGGAGAPSGWLDRSGDLSYQEPSSEVGQTTAHRPFVDS